MLRDDELAAIQARVVDWETTMNDVYALLDHIDDLTARLEAARRLVVRERRRRRSPSGW